MLVNLKELLNDAQKNHYAVGGFNTIDTDALEGAIKAAEEARSPIIVGTAEVLLPLGELNIIGPAMISLAKSASVPVAVHFDHGLTYERCMEALKLGFSSIMFDGSEGDTEENLRVTREIVRAAHCMGATVEGEIGHVGWASNGDEAASDLYTTPEEAVSFAEATGVDALAVAIGTAHGAYTTKPKLDIGRLKEIRAALDTPLVLHGGSGLSDDDFRNTIREGITKVNIYTDVILAGLAAMRDHIHESYVDIKVKKVEYIKREVMKKMELFGSVNKA